MDKLADYYAKRALEYERFYDKPERRADLTLLRSRIAGMFAGRNVLEVACGTGYWTALIAPAARGVTALDVNDEVLALARARGVAAIPLAALLLEPELRPPLEIRGPRMPALPLVLDSPHSGNRFPADFGALLRNLESLLKAIAADLR